MRKAPVGLYVVAVVAVVAAAAGVGMIWNGRSAAASAEGAARAAEVAAGPAVRLAKATLSPPVRKIELQGEARPFASVTLYAKVSGYLKRLDVDKGDRVRAGQTVAIIESPELDRQYDAAVADARYKEVEARRAASLAGPGVVSARQAELEESQANVARSQVAALATQKAYQQLRAPFAGTVTARFADPGALVQNAANAQTGALPVVTISQVERLRVYVYVDQRNAAFVHVGDAAEVRLADRGELVRPARVTRLANELDARTRMMLVEVDLDNADRAIVPGSFVQVALTVRAPQRVEVPSAALLLREKRPLVAVVTGGVARLKPVVVADDDGTRLQIAEGLAQGEAVVLDPGDAVADGARVRPVVEGNAPRR